jgi:ATP-dependent DNA helicase RecG
VHGNAFGILSEAESFLRKHLSIASFFKSDQFQRIDKPTLPVIAVREALINAICHRDYAQHAIDITLAVFDDRVEIWNSGELPSILKIADLKKTHPSIPRNPIIAKSFYIRGFIEAWGTGTNKMVALCRELDVPVPIFKQHFGGILVVLRFKEPLSTVSELSKFNLHTLSKRQIEILTVLISQGSEWVDHTTIYDGLIQPPARRTLQLDLRKLKEKGWLRMRGHAYSAQWGLIDNKKHKEEILKQLTQPGAT